MGLPRAAVAEEDHRLAVVDPGALRQRGDRGLGDLRVLLEAEVLQALHQGKTRVDQPSAFAAFSSLTDLGLQQRREIGGRGLLVACRLLGERAEASPDGWELQLERVRVDQGLHRLDLRRGAHCAPPAATSSSSYWPSVGGGA